MKTNYTIISTLLLLLLTFTGFSQVDVTLRLDMSGETVSSDGVHVAGTINGWCTDCDVLTQEGTTDIYSVTVQLSEGWHRYKFLNGNAWGTEESAGYPCAPSNGDRFLYINDSGNPVSLEPVPFNGCNPEGTGFSLTFNVDMSSEGTFSAGDIYMAGWFNDFNPSNFALPNKDSDIHSATLRLPTPSDYPIVFEYKYLSAPSWGNEETPGPADSCSTVNDSDNRIVTVNTSGENLYDVFNGCNYVLSTEDFNSNDLKFVYDSTSRNAELILENATPETLKLKVFDMNGREIKSIQKTADINTIKVNFQGIQNGIYIVKSQLGKSTFTKKLLVY